MTYRILIFSEEEENFVMEVIASPSTTFHELHTLIMEACGYTETGDHQFLICDEAWKVKEKIHLHSPQSIGLDEDLYMMDEVRLEEFLEEEGQHIAYIYETSSRKTLLLELVESLFGRKTDDAHVSRRKGTAPVQFDDRESEELNSYNSCCQGFQYHSLLGILDKHCLKNHSIDHHSISIFYHGELKVLVCLNVHFC